MATKPKHSDPLEALNSRAIGFLTQAELAGNYLYGVADAIEAIGDEKKSREIVHRLKHHANELLSARLWIEHEYKD